MNNKCPICDKIFKNNKNKERHLKNIHERNVIFIRPYKTLKEAK